ncbi:MaoC family dehydratase [Sphingobium sp. Cam5-1]|uniref:MaoC family dehydratase n=1 Tax=Sphingobium sp. Cam5-1 TaxID=2789327 RepID=UPI001E5D14EB|nr:MaoC family dehydratase [Sphingobium sp. Cam5-1]
MSQFLDYLQTRADEEDVSDWLLVSQEMIDQFAEATKDHQYIHVDPERARQSPFGGTIAHGFLTLSLLPHLCADARGDIVPDGATEINYGSNKLRFLAPVRSGKRVRGRFKPLEIVEKRPGQIQLTTEATVEVEGESKPALICEWITQFQL